MINLSGCNVINKSSVFIFSLFLFLLSGCAGSQMPLDGDSVKDRLVPGLRVLYFDGKFRSINQIPDGDSTLLMEGRAGKPVLVIDNQFGGGEVFDSGRNRAVGVQMKGYLLFEQPGRYDFQALSNDGIELTIDNSIILVDPKVHSDRLSDVGTLLVQEAGWQPLMVKYFQRKGTAALKLYWKTPGKSEFEIIPARAYGHLPDGSSR